MFPPIIDKEQCPYIGIRRIEGSRLFTIYLPNGDSYVLKSEEASLYLEMLGIDPNFKVLDYTQNFYTCIFDREKEVIEWCNSDKFKERMAEIVELYEGRIVIL